MFFFFFLFLNSILLISSLVTKTLSGIPYQLGSQITPKISRIEYVTITVDNLKLASEFYSNILGGYLIPYCNNNNTNTLISNSYCTIDGYVKYSGDIHHIALFGIDEEDNVNVPNIKDLGDYEVHSVFYILGNSLIQLIQFVLKSNNNNVYILRNNFTSPCWMANAHIDFWIEDSIDANDYIYDVEQRSHKLGGGGLDVKFNRPVPQQTRADRDNVPKSAYANKVVGGPFDGLAWAYFKGPIGEQLEIYQIDRTIKKAIGAAYCNRGAISTAFIKSSAINSNTSKYGWGDKTYQSSDSSTSSTTTNNIKSIKNSTSQRLHGIFQYGYRTNNLHRATGFYTEILGGDLITHPTQGIEIMRDDSAHWMILANETIESYEYSNINGISREEAMKLYGVANLSSTGYYRLDHRFILFDNYVVEPLQYTEGLTFGGKIFEPKYNHSSSSAYIGTITAAFGLDIVKNPSITSLTDYLNVIKNKLKTNGYTDVRLPLGLGTFPVDHPYSGLEYGTMKGPDGEVIQIITIDSMDRNENQKHFKNILHDALIKSGGISTAFNDTNPYYNNDMNEFCSYALYEDNYATMEGPINTTSSSNTVDQCNNKYITNDYTDDGTIIIIILVISVILLLLFGIIGFKLVMNEINQLKSFSTNGTSLTSKSSEIRTTSLNVGNNPIRNGNFDTI